MWYLGDKDYNAGSEKLWDTFHECKDTIEARFPNYHFLDAALHVDEQGAPHIHARGVFCAPDKYGLEAPLQDEALRLMGVDLFDTTKEKSRYNNRIRTFTEFCKAQMTEIGRAHGIEIEDTPRLNTKAGRDMAQYQADQLAAEVAQNRQKLAQTNEQLNQRRGVLADTTRKYAALAEKVENTEEKLVQMTEKVESMTEKVESVEREYQALSGTVEKKQKEVDKLDAQIQKKGALLRQIEHIAPFSRRIFDKLKFFEQVFRNSGAYQEALLDAKQTDAELREETGKGLDETFEDVYGGLDDWER